MLKPGVKKSTGIHRSKKWTERGQSVQQHVCLITHKYSIWLKHQPMRGCKATNKVKIIKTMIISCRDTRIHYQMFLSEKITLYDLHFGRLVQKWSEKRLQLGRSGGKKTTAVIQLSSNRSISEAEKRIQIQIPGFHCLFYSIIISHLWDVTTEWVPCTIFTWHCIHSTMSDHPFIE